MSAKQQSRKEGFWPFDDLDPESGDPTKPDPRVGDGSGSTSIKNYPSFTGVTIGKERKSEKLMPAPKRLRRKKAS